MTLLSEIVSLAQVAIGDSGAGTWPQSSVEGWCRAALRVLSMEFPRIIELAIAAVDAAREYELPADYHDAISVEYPAGEERPSYLQRWPRESERFWSEGGRYDVLNSEDGNRAARLVLNVAPKSGQNIRVIYYGGHDDEVDLAGPVSLPRKLHHLVTAYAVWEAWREREGQAQRFRGEQPEVLARARQASFNARQSFERLLVMARFSGRSGGLMAGSWRMDKYDNR